MTSDYTRNLGYSTLTPAQFEKLHFATLEILERTGVNIFHNEALELLKKAGARIQNGRVYIPSHLVKEALTAAPSSIHISNRSGNRAMTLENGRSYYGTGSDTPNVYDIHTKALRKAVKQDVANAARLCDALPNIDFVMSMGLVSDVPQDKSYVHQFEAMVLHTEKPILYTAGNLADLKDIYNMAAAAAGGEENLQARPFVILYNEPNSPLQHSAEALDKLLFCAEKRIPVIYAPAVVMGASGPVTPAGAVAQANAEILSGLVIHQLKAKGAPFITGGGAPPMDMRTMVCSYGAPERDLTCTALVALARYYDLPVFTTAGCSDAQVFDQQAGLEMGFNLLISGLAGGNLIHDIGYLGIGMTASLEAIVLCNEGIGMMRRLLRGMEVNDRTLALDVINDVGPGGDFLAEEHTVENFKNTISTPELLNRMNYDNWKNAGALTFGEAANRKVREILSFHIEKPLPESVVLRIKGISHDKIDWS
jgi:trimethylamine--corrinoid protein Co-methyltransferase